MALPLTAASNMETAVIAADVWTKVCSSVAAARITFKPLPAASVVWFTYVLAGGTAPSGLSGEMKQVNSSVLEFCDSVAVRDLYLYPVKTAVKIQVEA